MVLGAQVELFDRADVAQLTDAVVAVVVRHAVRVGHCATGLAEQRPAVAGGERGQDAGLHRFRHDLAPRGVLVRLGYAVGAVVVGDLVPVKQAGEHRRVRESAQLHRAGEMLLGVVQAGHEGPPVEDGPVLRGQRRGGAQGLLRDRLVKGFDAFVVDAGVGEQQRDPHAGQGVEAGAVLRINPVPGDDQHVVAQSAAVEVFQHGERVVLDLRQERVSGPVEHLHRRHVPLEVRVSDQQFDRFGVGHQRAGLPQVPCPVGMPDAVGAVQRAPHHMVQ